MYIQVYHNKLINNNKNKSKPTMSSKNNNKDEGTSNLPVQENKATDGEAPPCKKYDECVGTLLVHQSDVQELNGLPVSNITRRVTERAKEIIEKTEHVDPDDDILNWQCEA